MTNVTILPKKDLSWRKKEISTIQLSVQPQRNLSNEWNVDLSGKISQIGMIDFAAVNIG